jgi:PAS domain S-box-containing protein
MEISAETVSNGTVIGAALVAAALTYLRLTPGSPPGIGWWAIGFGFNLARFCSLLAIPIVGRTAGSIMAECLLVMMALSLLTGTMSFLGRPLNLKLLWSSGLVMVAWITAMALGDAVALARTIPLNLLAGGALVFSGAWLLRDAPSRTPTGFWITGGALILWGSNRIGFPFLQPLDWYAAHGFTAASIAAGVAALGLIVVAQKSLLLRAKDEAEKRVAVEISLQQKFSFLQTIIDAIPQPVYFKDRSDVYLGCNGAFANLLGRNVDEIIGKTAFDLAPRHLAERFRRFDDELLASGNNQSFEAVIENPESLLREFSFNTAVFKNNDGHVAGSVGVLMDLTERKQAEEALRKLSSAVEYGANAIFITDTKGAIEYANPALCSLTRYAQDELLGKNPRLLKSPHTSPETYQEMWRTISSGEVWQGVSVIKTFGTVEPIFYRRIWLILV